MTTIATRDALKIGVVVPTADRSAFLGHALRSLEGQTLPPDQVIIVDNGRVPTPRVNSFLPIEWHTTLPRIGAAAARNFGLTCITTNVVAFLDDDDWWPPNFLEACAFRLATDGVDAIAAALTRTSSDGTVYSGWKRLPSSLSGQRAVYWRNPGFTGSNVLYRTSVLRSVSGFADIPNMPASEDRDLLARLLESGFVIDSEPGQTQAFYREHNSPDRLSRKLARARLAFLRRHWQFMTPLERMRALLGILRAWS